jgi:radical SAM superfamily enzyme YgiQ (UPF0313 family)
MSEVAAMKRILFVLPNFESDFSIVRDQLNLGRNAPRTPMIPLQFATLAAVTPPGFQIDIWDESWRGEIDRTTNLGKDYDLVGVTGYQAHLPRANELGAIFRERGIFCVIGGPGVSGAPEVCRGKFDVVFVGEGELTWPRFLDEWVKGIHQTEYRQLDRIDMALSPPPKWDSIAADVPKYELAAVQTTRGCPFDCDFCDVIHLFGRKPRHKPIENVIKEIVTLHDLGASRVFLCDDDFVGDPKWAKQFLKALLPVNNSFTNPMAFTTQATVNAANDEELLELMADCNFSQLHIGVETPRASSLKEAHKLQNLRLNLVESCKKIQSYGIGVRALLIVGFDADDKDIFAEQIQFIEEANIVGLAVNVLKAYPGTPLWVRLQQEQRVIDMSDIYEASTKVVSNIIPKQMTRVELLEGYRALLGHVRSWESLERRAMGFVDNVRRRPHVKPMSFKRRFGRLSKLLVDRLRGRRKLPPEMRAMTKRLVRYTLRRAPYMLDRVLGLALQQAAEILVHPYQCAIIQKQIDATLRGHLRLELDPSAGGVPPDFRRKLRDQLPALYDQLSVGIIDSQAIPVALMGVIKDFLVRWGPSFTGFEPHHMTYLSELCDRHTERWLATHEGKAIVRNPDAFTREHVTNQNFIQALMVGVEQELRADVKPPLIQISNLSQPATVTGSIARA